MSPLAIHALLEFHTLAYPNTDAVYAKNPEAIRQLLDADMIQPLDGSRYRPTTRWELTKIGKDFIDQLHNTVPGDKGVQLVAEVTVEAEVFLDSYPIGTPDDIIARSQMDETIQRMSSAFAEKVSNLEGALRKAEAGYQRVCNTKEAQAMIIRSMKKQLSGVRRAMGVRPPRPKRHY